MKYFILALKLVFTALLLYFVFRGIDFSQAKKILYSKTGLNVLFCATFIMIVQTILSSFRLMLALKIFHLNIGTLFAIKLGFIGNFFSQILISFVGGDAMRLICLVRAGNSYGNSARAIFLDRVLGFISLQILFFMSIYYLLDFIQPGIIRASIFILAFISALMILMFFILGWLPSRFHEIKYVGRILDLASISRYLFRYKLETFYLLMLGVLVHFCNIFAIYSLAKLLNTDITFFNAFLVGIPVMYLSMLPFSVGGWGIRENSMIIGFSLLGVSSEISLTISIILGLGLLFASMPGALLFWNKQKNNARIQPLHNRDIITNA